MNLALFMVALGMTLSGSNLPDLEKEFKMTHNEGAFFSKSVLLQTRKNQGFLPTARPLLNRWWERGGGRGGGKIKEDMR